MWGSRSRSFCVLVQLLNALCFFHGRKLGYSRRSDLATTSSVHFHVAARKNRIWDGYLHLRQQRKAYIYIYVIALQKI